MELYRIEQDGYIHAQTDGFISDACLARRRPMAILQPSIDVSNCVTRFD